ncbi:MAG: glycosyltransferase [Bifidobacterium sp.]
MPWAKLVHYEQSEAYRSAGGGTAGHVNPLLAVAHVIRELEPDADIAVVGTVVGLEHDLVPQAGFELETIEKVPSTQANGGAEVSRAVEGRNGQSP